MNEKEFNLLKEPWIRVTGADLKTTEISLTDIFSRAHELKMLAGEMPTQDVAILRVLLAVVETVFYRYAADGTPDPFTEESDPDDVLDRWEEYWEQGRFNGDVFRTYLESCSERFWLFHPETPFWQVPDLRYGTEYAADCLVANLKESNNKATMHHFSMAEGTHLEKLSFPEAARWLIHYNAFAVNIKKDKKAPGTPNPVGTGRLGKLGLIMADGENLFQSLMLNLTPLKYEDNDGELWGVPRPVWEKPLKMEQGIEIAPPDNLPELYTIPSRRITLHREGNFITGFRALGGEYYSYENDFNEPMTIWAEKKEDKKSRMMIQTPMRHNVSVQAWREFPVIFDVTGKNRVPGIVRWIQILRKEHMTDKRMALFRTAGMQYDGMSYNYVASVNDSLALSAGLLDDLHGVWLTLISDEIGKCETVAAKSLYRFTADLSKLLYGKDDDRRKNLQRMLSERYYSDIDYDFREWLLDIDPESAEREEKIKEWERISWSKAGKVVSDFVQDLNMNIFEVRETDNGTVSIPKIVNDYFRSINHIYEGRSSEIAK